MRSVPGDGRSRDARAHVRRNELLLCLTALCEVYICDAQKLVGVATSTRTSVARASTLFARRTPRRGDFANTKSRLSHRAPGVSDTSAWIRETVLRTAIVEGVFPFAVDVELHLVDRRKR